MAAGSSFQRRSGSGGPLASLAGVSPSLHTSHLLTSCGTPHLDTLLGGGLPLGSLLLVQEDAQGSYGRLLLRYFLSEGLVHGHSLVSCQAGGRDLLSCLPSVEQRGEEGKAKEEGEAMRIAWRYQGQTNTKGEVGPSTGSHTFNLLKARSREEVEEGDATSIELGELEQEGLGWQGSSYCSLLRKIQEKLGEGGFLLEGGGRSDGGGRKVLRLGLASLGSLGWGGREEAASLLPTFLLSLRALLRSSLCVAVVTVPRHLSSLGPRLALCSDFLLELESFAGCEEEVGAAYKDYHGLVKIHKLPSLGALAPPRQIAQAAAGQLVFRYCTLHTSVRVVQCVCSGPRGPS